MPGLDAERISTSRCAFPPEPEPESLFGDPLDGAGFAPRGRRTTIDVDGSVVDGWSKDLHQDIRNRLPVDDGRVWHPLHLPNPHRR